MNYTRLINHFEDYIENHLSERILLDDVALELGVSPFHFHRIFGSQSNETVNQFITRIKLERAAIYLLVNKNMRITEIAFRYGYSSSSAFNKAFKKKFGSTPLQFRNSKNGQVIQ